MVLHDVAQRTDLVVEAAAVRDVEVLGHGDLDRPDIPAVPHRSSTVLANRSRRICCTDIFPRKWSIRYSRDSRSIARSDALSACADARSWPNGFSTTTRAWR